MFVILGATGRVGGAAATELRRRGLPVRAVLRDMTRGERLAQLGCELAQADLLDPQAVARALQGAEGALVICPLRANGDDPAADAQRIIDSLGDAIDIARPRAVVVISDYGAQVPAGTGVTLIFHRLEARLRKTSVPMTFLRSAEHMQNSARHLRAARERGVLVSLHHPVTKLYPTVSAPDVGLIAADLLGEPPPSPGTPRIVHAEGPRRYSAQDVAKVFERIVERPVVPQALERERWLPALLAGGLSAAYAQLVAELQDAHNAGHIDAEAGVGEVRRGATELERALIR
ncbi:NmrA family transcriptional regulator [Corallococcus sp. H22C18031201]|uniref:NmrA family NAD(P)-binding protein n=1 Tax=Citreicoccus inhibens TaxID=2849499 RepID=UPI000E71964D|nr:NmrA family NAD(P)-binding protein [Citreicoccus inhibens]MBU8896822.1 NAD(P)H-binding protein [Citreicoccus inhibens]RJS21883.1 NmrA family transcriptional regulator [Corallococcus sp. H22C18031201]